MKRTTIMICLFIIITAMTGKNNTGVFENNNDIGNPKIKGSAIYDSQTKTYTLTGGGYNIWFARDEFQYAWKKIKGDFILTADFEFVGIGKEAHRKTGWMVRQSLADSAVHISATDHGDGLTVLQWRVKPGMNMRDPEDEIRAPGAGYSVVQLQRSGNKFTMRVAKKEGEPFVTVGEHEMENMPGEVLAGIFICSHNPEVSEQVIVRHVKISQ
jgi:TolB protein